MQGALEEAQGKLTKFVAVRLRGAPTSLSLPPHEDVLCCAATHSLRQFVCFEGNRQQQRWEGRGWFSSRMVQGEQRRRWHVQAAIAVAAALAAVHRCCHNLFPCVPPFDETGGAAAQAGGHGSGGRAGCCARCHAGGQVALQPAAAPAGPCLPLSLLLNEPAGSQTERFCCCGGSEQVGCRARAHSAGH